MRIASNTRSLTGIKTLSNDDFSCWTVTKPSFLSLAWRSFSCNCGHLRFIYNITDMRKWERILQCYHWMVTKSCNYTYVISGFSPSETIRRMPTLVIEESCLNRRAGAITSQNVAGYTKQMKKWSAKSPLVVSSYCLGRRRCCVLLGILPLVYPPPPPTTTTTTTTTTFSLFWDFNSQHTFLCFLFILVFPHCTVLIIREMRKCEFCWLVDKNVKK